MTRPAAAPRDRTAMRDRLVSAALAVRFAIAGLAAVATLLLPAPTAGVVALAVLGTALATVVPTFSGALVLLLVEVFGWTAGYGSDVDPPVLRTVVFAVVLYLLQAATALAASVPADAALEPAVVARWTRSCLPGAAAAVVAGLAVSLIDRSSGSLALDVVGLVAGAAAVGALVWAGRSRR